MKNIAVIGANRGIGLEFVRQLQKEHNVYAFCRKAHSELNQLTTKIVEEFEVTDLKSIQKGLEKVAGVKFDWLIHVSGIFTQEGLENLNLQAIQQQFLVNSLGPLMVTQAFLPFLNPEAKIALLTSRMGSIADNSSGDYYGYRMSKAALNAAGKSLAIDLKRKKHTVLLLHPGYVKTDMTNHQGDIDVKESVQGMLKIIQTKDISDTGTFWHTNGEPLPW